MQHPHRPNSSAARANVGLLGLLAAYHLLAAALPASAAQTCGDLKQFASVDMTLDSFGRPLVPVAIDGKQQQMMLDTGGVISTLTQRAFEETGRTALRRDDIVLDDVRGNRMDRSVTLPYVTIGQVRSRSWRFWIHAPDMDLGSTTSGPVAGTLAPDVLAKFDVDLDFGRKTVKLFSPDHCEGRVLYWMPSALAVIPFEREVSGHIMIPVSIDGQRLQALVDTGAASTMMNLTVAQRRFGLDEGTTNTGPSVHQFRSLELQGLAVANPIIRLIPDRIAQVMPSELGGVMSAPRQGLADVIIGQNIIGKFHLYIAYGESRLYLTD